jgi:hypothetical protein
MQSREKSKKRKPPLRRKYSDRRRKNSLDADRSGKPEPDGREAIPTHRENAEPASAYGRSSGDNGLPELLRSRQKKRGIAGARSGGENAAIAPRAGSLPANLWTPALTPLPT